MIKTFLYLAETYFLKSLILYDKCDPGKVFRKWQQQAKHQLNPFGYGKYNERALKQDKKNRTPPPS